VSRLEPLFAPASRKSRSTRCGSPPRAWSPSTPY